LDLDIKAFFDNLDQDLLLRAVKKHASQRWMVLYIERWLKAPVQEEEGRLVPREKGTPQGGAVSPLLANLFLHYALDRWMAVKYPRVPFERYADDVIVHCRTEREAEEVRNAIAARLRDCRLELHPEKTKIVYCKDELRKRRHDHEKLDFLGYEFRPRRSKSRTGKAFLNFSPAISTKAAKAIRERIRSWKLPKGSDEAIEELSRLYNPIIRGGSNITGGFTAQRSTRSNVNWTKSWSSGPKGNTKSYANISGGHDTGLLASRAGVQSCLLTGRWHVTRLHDGSCMSREAQVQFCERLGVRLPGATLPRGIPNQDAKLDLSLPVADDNTGSCACFQEMVGVRQPVQQSGWLPLQQQHFEASRRCTE
jgi:hypothetical protein